MYLLIFLRQSDREEKAVETMGDKEKKRGGKERDRERVFHLLVYYSSAPQRPRPGIKNSSHFSHISGRNLRNCFIICYP